MFNHFVWPSFVKEPAHGDDPKNDAGRKRTRFLLRVAALHASEEGTLAALSERLGLASGTIATYASDGSALTPEMALLIEGLSGGVCRACYFRPDVFPPPSQRSKRD
jgi:DNA-binding transcriptional regulator YdaS (Cro superfamily)